MKLFFAYILSFLFFNGGGDFPALDSLLSKEFNDYSRFEYKIVKPKHFSSLEIDKNKSIRRNGSYVYIPADVTLKDGKKQRTIVSLKIKLYKKVLVAKKNIKRKEKFGIEDFTWAEKEVTRFNREIFSRVNEIEGYRSKSFIKKGDILESKDMERIPVVIAGDKLKAKFVDGNVMISFDVIAKQEGYYGEIIKVMKKNYVYSAKIVDAQNVLIME